MPLFGNEKNLKAAKRSQERRIKQLRARDRLLPCLEVYDGLLQRLIEEGNEAPYEKAMSHLTAILRGTYDEVLQQIQNSGKTGIRAINAVKRSAGTNYQGLCEYAILKWLGSTELPFHVGPNAPKSMKDELTIYGRDSDSGEFSVEPDIDISLYLNNGDDSSPLIFVSAKTSLVDRAGQAARWKMYFDMHQTSCVYTDSVCDCPINRTKIKINTKHPIVNAIVTANIYKIDTTQPHGELTSGQCRNNTYMFKHKYTTRNDAEEIRPQSWKSFSDFPLLVKETYAIYAQDEASRGA